MQSAGDIALRPGEIVMRTLFADFTQQTEKKIEAVMLETSVNHILGFSLFNHFYLFIFIFRIKI